MKFKSFWIVLIAMLPLFSCVTAPITGRSQLNLVSDSVVIAQSNQAFSGVLKFYSSRNALLRHGETEEGDEKISIAQRVTRRVLENSGLAGLRNWEVFVVRDSTPNAFVFPNGKIFINEGMFEITQNDAGLATIIGHEAGHIAAGHQAERISQRMLAQTTLALADAALSVKYPDQNISAALGAGMVYGILLPYSREHEFEADYIGMLYMAKAGYDPGEAVKLWERMAARGSSNMDFFSTHPADYKRVAAMRQNLSGAKIYFTYNNLPLPSNMEQMKTAIQSYIGHANSAPVAESPAIKPGFWYSTKSSEKDAAIKTYRLEGIESCAYGNCGIYKEKSGKIKIQTADHTSLVGVRNADGTWIRFCPPLRILRWPLKIGDSWENQITLENHLGGRKSVKFLTDILAYEPVFTEKRSFMGYKVIVSSDGNKFMEAWYSPEAKTFVRTITYALEGGQINMEELTEYKTD